ncbi:MAG: CTP synthase [Candidatus Magasanikbacteria bacterium]
MNQLSDPKYVFVVGGVMSGVGKGVTTASLGTIFKAKGFNVTALKADPYVNVDAGTMSPTEHGEVFVTKDGDETDQDMGNYERFLNEDLTSTNYMTTGRVYSSVIERERSMGYDGKCVQVVPHIPEEIIRRIEQAQEKAEADITITEIGGTVGEYENILFLEAAREMKLKNPEDVAIVLVSYLPVPEHIGEMKTKPTQHASRQLNEAGINADIIIGRSKTELDKPRYEKISVFCGLPKDHVISAPDVDSIYQVPLNFEEENLGNKLLNSLGVKGRNSDLTDWRRYVEKPKDGEEKLSIAVVGKYFETGDFTLSDSYISVIEAVEHASAYTDVDVDLEWVDSEEYTENPGKAEELKEFDGVIVPGGFGTRGVEGIVTAIEVVRKNNIPYLGLCYGMQLACIEFMRNVLEKNDANSVEIDPDTTHPIIDVNPHQEENINENRYGGTMRLGAFDAHLKKDSKVHEAYDNDVISERHRHRYEFNNKYRDMVDEAGLKVVGENKERNLVEIVELENHPFFIGVQFHPEFVSRPMEPHPLFLSFLSNLK